MTATAVASASAMIVGPVLAKSVVRSPMSMPTASASAVDVLTAPAMPWPEIATLTESALEREEAVMAPVLRICSFPSPPLMPRASA